MESSASSSSHSSWPWPSWSTSSSSSSVFQQPLLVPTPNFHFKSHGLSFGKNRVEDASNICLTSLVPQNRNTFIMFIIFLGYDFELLMLSEWEVCHHRMVGPTLKESSWQKSIPSVSYIPFCWRKARYFWNYRNNQQRWNEISPLHL